MKKKLIIAGLVALIGVGATLGIRNREKPFFGTTNISYNGHECHVTYFEKEGFNLSCYNEEGELPDTIFLKYSGGDFGVGSMDERTLEALTGQSDSTSRREFREVIRNGLNEVLEISEGSTIPNLEIYR